MTEDKGFQLRNETVRTVNVKLNRKMYRRLALSASMNRRSLGKEAVAIFDMHFSSTIETDYERQAGEMAMADITRKEWEAE